MAAFTPNKLIQPATHAPRLFPRVPGTKHRILKTHRLISTIHPMAKTNKFSPGCITKVDGIFGVASSKKSDIEAMVEQVESQNPTPDPSLKVEQVGGCWKLVYSTITILGSKRTKLGLRDFITLGDFFQTIDIQKVRVDREIYAAFVYMELYL
ncbi:hypothetical protein V6N13_145364 [Hibiscus sabdariffa]|uniref:Plastid lipid-associated protein/fibrillin conserved domain-containing protein n=1 Tax=Hibiscus sabdariffa TaxID=183260 RepID=A0ABR2TPD3_9ROSI